MREHPWSRDASNLSSTSWVMVHVCRICSAHCGRVSDRVAGYWGAWNCVPRCEGYPWTWIAARPGGRVRFPSASATSQPSGRQRSPRPERMRCLSSSIPRLAHPAPSKTVDCPPSTSPHDGTTAPFRRPWVLLFDEVLLSGDNANSCLHGGMDGAEVSEVTDMIKAGDEPGATQ